MSSSQQQQKVTMCRNNCGTRIRFDPMHKSASGKMIPLEYATGQDHQCPNSTYANNNKQQQPQQQQPQPQPQQQQQLTTNTPTITNEDTKVFQTSALVFLEGISDNLNQIAHLMQKMSDNISEMYKILSAQTQPMTIQKASHLPFNPESLGKEVKAIDYSSIDGPISSVEGEDEN
jgi:hypothetical protein